MLHSVFLSVVRSFAGQLNLKSPLPCMRPSHSSLETHHSILKGDAVIGVVVGAIEGAMHEVDHPRDVLSVRVCCLQMRPTTKFAPLSPA